MGKRKFKDEDYWAQVIIRAQSGGKDYIYALVRRKYDEDDIEQKGPGEWIGTKRVERFAKVTDNDPESETFGKRVDKEGSEPIGTQLVYTDEFNAENKQKYKSLCGVTNFGETKFTWKFKQINIEVDNVDDFWSKPQNDAYNELVLKKPTVIIHETNKSNNTRRTSK